MRFFKTFMLALACCLIALPAFSRKAKLLEGSLDALKGVKKMNIQFMYDNITIGKDEMPEAEYIAKHTAEANEKEKGKGDMWARNWVANRERKYQVSFRNGFNRDSKIKVGDFKEEKYTMIFKTKNIEPGYNVVISQKPSRLTGEAWVVETASPDQVICKLLVKDCPGAMMGADFDGGERLRYSYIVASDMLKAYFERQLF